jgi:FAD/FMN-containing dehydrogenase
LFLSLVVYGKYSVLKNWDSKQDELIPTCRIEPETPEQVSKALGIIADNHCPFAIRSGGHAPNTGHSSSDGGVVLDLARFNGVDVSEDKKTAKIGPGATWYNALLALEKEGVSTVGGRYATVGVGGLTLGGKFTSCRT